MPPRIRVEILGDDTSLLRSFHRSSVGARGFERDIGRVSRGALAGSGIFRGLGRSIAFASGGFLAFASAGQFIRSSIDAAKEAQVTQKQLGQQLRNNGKAFADYKAQIDRANLSLSGLSGFNKDELDQSLTTILRTVPNVSRALRDNALAADLARARHISLAQASLVVAKTEAGNTTLLRRQGFQIAKNATVEQALAAVRAKVAGQARAGTTEQERFGAVLHDTEVIIGTALLPTLNKLLLSGTKWLQQMNESGRLQHDVQKTAREVTTAFDDLRSVVRGVDNVTGGFKNTLELLLALKVGSTFAGYALSIGRFTTEMRSARLATLGLGGAISALSGPLTVAIGGLAFLFEQIREDAKKTQTIAKIAGSGQNSVIRKDGQFFKLTRTAGRGPAAERLQAITPQEAARLAKTDVDTLTAAFAKAKPDTGFRAPGITEALSKAVDKATNDAAAKVRRKGLSATQRNTFFDNALSRLLDRSQDGGLKDQIRKLQAISKLISARIAVTKDVTRKLNLEDQLVAVGRTIRSDRAQLAQNVADRLQAQNDKIKADAATRLAQRTARQFRELGLTATGDDITPGVANLRKRLASIAERATGTSLDTPKLRSQLARFRKVVSEGLVPKDVRAKIRDMLNGISDELKNHLSKNETLFRHESSAQFVRGVTGLAPQQVRELRSRFSQVGRGGTVPGARSQAFSPATTVIHLTTNLDGQKVAVNTFKHQAKRRAPSRRN